jgi:NAD(P)H dehydrogenase (quinone)
MLRHLLQGTLGYVGFDVLLPFFAYHTPYIDPELRRHILQDLETYVSRVDTLGCIPMPSATELVKYSGK